jgi:hypothetical protein
MIKTYKELRNLTTFDERFEYLKLEGIVGRSTFGVDRYLNQILYKSKRWKKTRDEIIIRDNACDLGMPGFDIYDKIIIHHINPITIDDVEEDLDLLYDPDGLICTSFRTHNSIHYGGEPPKEYIERTRNDTCPWKNN